VDRYYIDGFLARHAADIRGRVLEIGDRTYTRRFGADRVIRSDVLDVKDNPQATFHGQLPDVPQLPSESFDCVLLPQTLHQIYETGATLRTLHRVLRPGGVLLATFPGITRLDQRGGPGDRWYWSFTSLSARQLFTEVFPAGQVQIEAFGNVLAAVAALHGLAAEELLPEERDHRDPNYELAVAARAVR